MILSIRLFDIDDINSIDYVCSLKSCIYSEKAVERF